MVMRQSWRRQCGMMLILALSMPGWLWAQPQDDLTQKLVQSYDLLEAGKLAQAKQLYQEILKEHPDNPLALNNLGAILVREKDYQGAMAQLEKALPRSRGYRVKVNKVCDVEGVCLAFRPLALEYGDQDLEPLIRLNVELLKARMAAEGPAK
jgi:tetratricopeptide (TPR) repeat protein